MHYAEQKFNVPDLAGLSEKQLGEHLKLYAGYVKHVNALHEHIKDLSADPDKNAYLISEMRRRFGFEFNGMRMHEYYFESFENGAVNADAATALQAALRKQFGSLESWREDFRKTGMTRGVGWAILYTDTRAKILQNVWVEDHELGQLAGLPVILAMDMWEHAFMVDYTPSEKKEYINAFFANLNWSVSEERFKKSGM